MLTAESVRLVRPKDVTPEQANFLASYFERTVLPVVTPLAIDPGHPFPHLANGSLCLVVTHEPAVRSPLPHSCPCSTSPRSFRGSWRCRPSPDSTRSCSSRT
jgi:hypothetical protein